MAQHGVTVRGLWQKLTAPEPTATDTTGLENRFDSLASRLDSIDHKLANAAKSRPRIHVLALFLLCALFASSLHFLLQGLEQNQNASEEVTLASSLSAQLARFEIGASDLDTEAGETLSQLSIALSLGDHSLAVQTAETAGREDRESATAAKKTQRFNTLTNQSESALTGAFNDEDDAVLKIALASVVLGGIGSFVVVSIADRSRYWRWRRKQPASSAIAGPQPA
jgi:hypothetical protein